MVLCVDAGLLLGIYQLGARHTLTNLLILPLMHIGIGVLVGVCMKFYIRLE